MILYGTTLFLSGFLLFLVQPLVGKYILPWFGGGPAVWTTCMLFFQALLLGGYSYAHFLASRCPRRRQPLVHLALLAAALAVLPIAPSESWKLSADHSPVWQILGLLTVTVGAPYFALSAASPLLQSWSGIARPGVSPYRLYSLSSLGSLLAILLYPFWVEPVISLSRQVQLWSLGYAVSALLSGVCALQILKSKRPPEAAAHASGAIAAPPQAAASPGATHRFLWLSLPACSSVMLLATTNQLCQDVAVIPLLWILPLGLYLLSYILCFHSARWYPRSLFGIALAVASVQACSVLFGGVFIDLRLQIVSYSFTLFTCCMVCHGELVRLKPPAARLTAFYWMISAGSALGGGFVTLVAPLVFKGFWEFHLGLGFTVLLLYAALCNDKDAPLYRGRPFWAWTPLYASFFLLLTVLGLHVQEAMQDNIIMTRSFFGLLRVLDQESGSPDRHRYTLMHGRIWHGFQFQDREKRYWPTSYFGPESGVGIALLRHPSRSAGYGKSLRIGVVGLGTGTLAAYGRPGDSMRFYEIDPAVVSLAKRYFTYLGDCAAQVDVVLGDARITLEQEKERGELQQFDVLAIDAFTSDAIPVHLLTRECFQIYRSHLKQDGILAVHVSNLYFDLIPVVRGGLAALDPEQGMQALWFAGRGYESQGTDSSDWVLLTGNRAFLESPEVQRAVRPWSRWDRAPLLWTDDYSNLFRLMRRRDERAAGR